MQGICTICKTSSSRISQCTGCQYLYCAESCMSYGPAVPRSFLCPDCSSCKRLDCEMGLARRQPVQVTVLILHIQSLHATAGNLMNVIESALNAYNLKSVFQFMTLKSCIDNPVDLAAFLGISADRSIERKGVLLVLMVTETADGGWWVGESGENSYCMKERKMLQRLFCEDQNLVEHMSYIRVPLLFVLSCGGNLDTDLVEDLRDWNKSNRCFLHMFAFLNTRLRWAEVCGFFSKLTMSAFGRFEPLHRAVVESWCLDENTRYHSGLVWWAVDDETPFVLRENTSKCPFGVPLPDVRQLCGCPDAKTGRWKVKSWSNPSGSCQTGSSLSAASTCCGYRLVQTLLEKPPRTYVYRNIGYVLDKWPAVATFKAVHHRRNLRDTSEGTQAGETNVVSGDNEAPTQKRPRTSDVDAGPSKRRGGDNTDDLDHV